MAEQHAGEASHRARFRHRLSAEIPTIKILIYADDPDTVNLSSSLEQLFSLGLLVERLRAREPASARFSITYANRYDPSNTDTINKIHDVLADELTSTGQPFDEIWFFGMHQSNLSDFSLSFFQGGPENEFDENEVNELLRWMGDDPGGGVLMSGDHSNPRPSNPAPSTNPRCPDRGADAETLSLGRAIGRCVPRAGSLRVWEGGPTNIPGDSHNTVKSPGGERDDLAQNLIPRNLNAFGEPDPNGQPHSLFYYKPGKVITSFPDHPHEGLLADLRTLDPALWPPSLNEEPQPLPQVVAYGINQRTSQCIDLLAVYDGDRAGVGRIVADSSWHHYLNLNLRGFPHPAPEDSPSDQISQFYSNLAVWLSPQSKRRQMGHAILWQIARYTMLLERRPDDPAPAFTLGPIVSDILSRIASPCEVNELLHAMTPKKWGTLEFAEQSSTLSYMPSRELLLGSIICAYHDELLRADKPDESFVPREVDEVIASGFESAFENHINYLKQTMTKVMSFIDYKS